MEKVATISETRPVFISVLSSPADRCSLLISGPVELNILIFSFIVSDFFRTGLKQKAEEEDDWTCLDIFSFSQTSACLPGGPGALLDNIKLTSGLCLCVETFLVLPFNPFCDWLVFIHLVFLPKWNPRLKHLVKPSKNRFSVVSLFNVNLWTWYCSGKTLKCYK